MIHWLNIQLETELFDKTCKHVIKSMFFCIKRLAPNLRHVVFHSSGDSIDTPEDINKAEIFFEKKLDDNKIGVDDLSDIIKYHSWNIQLTEISNKKQQRTFSFVVDKKTEEITKRSANFDIKKAYGTTK